MCSRLKGWRRKWESLGTRLTIAMAGLVIGSALVLGALASSLLSNEFDRRAQIRADDAQAVADALVREEIGKAAAFARWAASDPQLVVALRKQDPAEVDSVIGRLAAVAPRGLVQVADTSGRWASVRPSPAVEDAQALVDDALQGTPRAGLSKTSDCRLAAVASAPVSEPVQGAVVVSLPLDQDFIQRLDTSAHANAWLLCGSTPRPIVWGPETLEIDQAISEIVQAQGKPGSGTSRADGVVGYGNYIPLRDIGGRVIGMYGLSQPVEDITAARDDAIRIFVIIGLLMVIAVLLEAYLLAHRITTPLKVLTEATRALGENLPPTGAPGVEGLLPPLDGEDEIALLARSFEEMRARLSETHATLVQEKDRYRDFLAILPHEFKTPLSAVVASLELLETDESQLSPDQRSLLGSIRRSVIRLQSLVNNLLDSASLQVGQFQVHAEPHHLPDLIEQMRLFVQPLLDKKRQALEIKTDGRPLWDLDQGRRAIRSEGEHLLGAEGDPNVSAHNDMFADPLKGGQPSWQGLWPLPRVMADPRRITQVLINLISNASKYGPAGESICLELVPSETYLRVSVIDHGPGISVKEQSRLFQRFVRVGKGAAEAAEGMGFGLAIVKEIVEKHGGQVGINSELGRGTTVWFTLPVAEVGTRAPVQE